MLRIRMGGSAGLRMMMALPCFAPPITSKSARSGEGKLVDVLARAGSGRQAGNRADHLGIRDRRDARDRINQRNGRLSATGDQVDVLLIQMLAQIHGGDHVRSTRGRRQVNGDAPGFPQHLRVTDVGVGAGRVEHDANVRVIQNGLDAFVAGVDSQRSCTRQSFRLRFDAGQQRKFHVTRFAQDLEHQIAADVAGAKDGNFDLPVFCVHQIRVSVQSRR